MRKQYHETELGETPQSAAQDTAERPAGSTAALLDVPSSPSVGPTRGYEGFANYESWLCQLWIDDEQASYRYWVEATREATHESHALPQVRSGLWTHHEAARIHLANRLKQEITDAAPDLGASLSADLLFAGLSEIDWFQIADSLLDDHGGEDGHE